MLFTAIGRVLRRLAAGSPLVLLLDDAQHIGESTAAWLHHVVRRADPPMLVVVARRTGVREGGSTIEPTRVIDVGPLDVTAATQIVGSDRAAELLDRSGGNALFLVELAATAPGSKLPASIRAAVADRVRDAGVGATLQVAAVLGADVDLDVLAAVLSRSALDVLDDLESGLGLGLLHEREGRLEFRHALIREALATEVSAPRRGRRARRRSRTGGRPLRLRGGGGPAQRRDRAASEP
jgi:hypothetical protein